MGSVSLDQILRSLEPRGEVRFALGDVPVDDLLLTLHETRFTGTVEPGKYADLTVISDDIFSGPSEAIRDATVDMTVVGGEFVKSYGGEVRLAQLVDGYSTTAAIARMQEKA